MITRSNIFVLVMLFLVAPVASSAAESAVDVEGEYGLGGGYFDIAYISGEVGEEDTDYGVGFDWLVNGTDSGVFIHLSGDLIQFEGTSGLSSRMLAVDLSFPRHLIARRSFELQAYGAVGLILSKYDLASDESYNIGIGPRVGGGLNTLLAGKIDLGAELMLNLLDDGAGASTQTKFTAGYRVTERSGVLLQNRTYDPGNGSEDDAEQFRISYRRFFK